MSSGEGACGLWQKAITPLTKDDIRDTAKKEAQYQTVQKALTKFFNKYDVECVGRMATICSYLKLAFPYMSFVGFYTNRGNHTLGIGPYQGELIACGLIDFGKGVCGVAAQSVTTQRVDDVNKIENYIACDDVTQSEIVVPVTYPGSMRVCRRFLALSGYMQRNTVYLFTVFLPVSVSKQVQSVLDIDADVVEAFDETDEVS